MLTSKYRAIRCTISRGGFSDERVFDLVPSGVAYSGVASRRYMWTGAGKPVEEGEPPLGETIEGLVAARVLEVQGQNQVLVSIPDGAVIAVPADKLVDRPTGVGEHVSIGS